MYNAIFGDSKISKIDLGISEYPSMEEFAKIFPFAETDETSTSETAEQSNGTQTKDAFIKSLTEDEPTEELYDAIFGGDRISKLDLDVGSYPSMDDFTKIFPYKKQEEISSAEASKPSFAQELSADAPSEDDFNSVFGSHYASNPVAAANAVKQNEAEAHKRMLDGLTKDIPSKGAFKLSFGLRGLAVLNLKLNDIPTKEQFAKDFKITKPTEKKEETTSQAKPNVDEIVKTLTSGMASKGLFKLAFGLGQLSKLDIKLDDIPSKEQFAKDFKIVKNTEEASTAAATQEKTAHQTVESLVKSLTEKLPSKGAFKLWFGLGGLSKLNITINDLPDKDSFVKAFNVTRKTENTPARSVEEILNSLGQLPRG